MMTARLRMIRVLLMGAMVATTAAALAGPNEPFKARIGRSDLVTAYSPCTAPNTTLQMSALPLPACGPALPNDSVCQFGSHGVGTFKASASSGPDLTLSASLSGLGSGCIGRILCPVASIRLTTNDCSSGDPNGCTAIDVSNIQLGTPDPLVGCCIVSPDGRCSLKARLSQVLPGVLASGQTYGLEVVSAGVNRVTGPTHAAPTFSLGFLAR